MTADQPQFIIALLAAVLVLVVLAAIVLLREASSKDVEARMKTVMSGARGGDDASDGYVGVTIAGLLERLGESVRRGTKLYSDDDLAAMEGMIAAAGLKPTQILPIVLGVKVIMMILVPVAAYIYTTASGYNLAIRIASVIMAVPGGLLLPDWIMRFLRRPYVSALQRGVGDSLDLLVICTEAGMGLESALEHVSREMRHSNRPMASALNSLLDELRVLPDRREALINFGRRTGVEGIRRMTAMLAQTLQYGTPLGQALRSVAGDLRRDRMIRLEERTARLPALLVFPLVFFIMPSMFIVMGGIPVLGLVDLLTSATGTGGQ